MKKRDMYSNILAVLLAVYILLTSFYGACELIKKYMGSCPTWAGIIALVLAAAGALCILILDRKRRLKEN